ncbi:MAG: alpha/beta hydrolase [Pirellulaceae bacterium]|nr:alpha/beta hydrolase [Pirellulaceae bacterium]
MRITRNHLATARRIFSARFCVLLVLASVAVCCWSITAATAFCQVKAGEQEEEKIPPPEDMVLETADNVLLAITYYPSLKGKEAIPIVLLHDFKQSRSEYIALAPALQTLGYAVVVPDLRGHGGSTRVKDARDVTLEAASMAPAQFGRMVTHDMKTVKDFLWDRNNAGELNIDKLCVVGAGMGSSVALDFAWYDAIGYNYGFVFYGPLKLGRFVKALVLISPEWSFRGLPLRRAAGNEIVQSNISMLILVGKRDGKAMSQAKRIHGIFERFHPEPTGDDKLDRQTLFLGGLDTSLQGTKLLDPRFNVAGIIADFVDRRLQKSSESREWTWKERKFPHQ